MKIPWLLPGERFPDASFAWGAGDPVPGLLAAAGSLDVQSLHGAYSGAIFPWFSDDQPILWWSPDPRMTLAPRSFRLHRSLRRTIQQFRNDDLCEIRIDGNFRQVIEACSSAMRSGQPGTWIGPQMVDAYCDFHQAGFAHSIETWIDGELAGGLYCVGIGRAVFGESMFARKSNASKIALAALVCFCLRHRIKLIDCQQNTSHLASLGAVEMPRDAFVKHVVKEVGASPPSWHFDPLYWDELMPAKHSPTT